MFLLAACSAHLFCLQISLSVHGQLGFLPNKLCSFNLFVSAHFWGTVHMTLPHLTYPLRALQYIRCKAFTESLHLSQFAATVFTSSCCEDGPQCSLDKMNLFASGFCNNRVLCDRVISPQSNPPTWRTREPLLVWSSLDLFGVSGPTRSQRLQLTLLYGSLRHTNHSTTVRWWSLWGGHDITCLNIINNTMNSYIQ